MSEFYDSIGDWNFIQKLGSGAFAEVSLWTNSVNYQSVAIKTCTVDLNHLDPDEREKLKTRWSQERTWLAMIKTENIIHACPNLCPMLVDELNLKTKLPVIVMEYCDGGNLRNKLQQIENINGLREYDVRQVLCALKNAIAHLHNEYNITHRDIKPENIIIKHDDEGKLIYKLADMGYARQLDQNAIASMVGSRNYYAPEIVEYGCYTMSVDYWSTGIVAFEIMCGVYPFPHDQSMFEVIKNIKEKPQGCVAISKDNKNKLIYHHKLFPENFLSDKFRRLIEEWLQLALEYDGEKRGSLHETRIPLFITKLDAALNTKMITVFWINRCRCLSYDVNEYTTIHALYAAIQRDTGLNSSEFILVPSMQPHNTSGCIPDQSIQWYHENCASSDVSMIYLADFCKTGLCCPDTPLIADAMKQFFVMTDCKPNMLKQFLLNALFVCHNELRRSREYVNGIKELAMNLEDNIIKVEHSITTFHNNIEFCCGQICQHNTMIYAISKGNQVPNVVDNEWENIMQNLHNLRAQNFNGRLKIILSRIREFLKDVSHFTDLKVLINKVEEFEELLKSGSIANNQIKNCIAGFLEVRSEFFETIKKNLQNRDYCTSGLISSERIEVDCICNLYKEFNNINNIVKMNNMDIYQQKIAEKTTVKIQEFLQNQPSHMHLSDLGSMVVKMDTFSLDDAISLPTLNIIDETTNLSNQINMSLNFNTEN